MEIKKNLKALDVKLSKMAADFKISRPTLDNYIECYEKGIPLTNEQFQKIFEYLFSSEEMSSVEFAQRYDYVKRVMLNDISGAKAKGDAERREIFLKEKIQDSIFNGKVSKSFLEFFMLLINNASSPLVKALCDYFNYSNGFIQYNENDLSNNNKAFFSLLAKLFAEYQSESLEVDSTWLESFVKKSNMMYEKKNAKLCSEDIIQYIKDNVSSSGNIDYDFLRQMMEHKESDD